MLAYRALAWLLHVAVRAFFRRVEVVGLEHVPREGDGPVIFCGNHPNSLLDPVLITVTCGRVVHFAAKDVLFKSRLLRFLLTKMGAVPIRRRQDHGGGAGLDNSSAFDKLFEVLGEGRAMGIFPEGISHADSQIARLKTGAARVAFGAAARYPGVKLTVIPRGLHYVSRDRFRSSVLVQFGEPIVIDTRRLAAHEADEQAAVRVLTDQIDAGIRALTVNADDWQTIRVLDGVRRLYQPREITLQERVELARRFNAYYPTVRDDPRVKSLYSAVEHYLNELVALGITDRDVVRRLTPRAVAWRVVRHTVRVLVWLPIAIAGAPVHVPVGLLLLWSAPKFTPRKDVLATTKFLIGFLLLLLLYGVLAVWAGVTWGPLWGVATLFGLPLSGYAGIVVARNFGAIDRSLTALLGRFSLGAKLRALITRRDALQYSVIEAVNELRPVDLDLMFPQQQIELG